MASRFSYLSLAALALLGACAPSSPEGAPPASREQLESERDVRVPIPDDDPDYVTFVSPEAVIMPGEERMWCAHFRWDREDVAFDVQEILQGPMGHHAVLIVPDEPRAPGTIEDCTDAESNARFDRHFANIEPLPPGYAIKLPHGMQLAMQFHYVNAGRVPIRVRDVARLHRVPLESVQKFADMFTIQALDKLTIAPKTRHTLAFDCTAPDDGELILAIGHMHENGTEITVQLGPNEGALETIYKIDNWNVEFRDGAPVVKFYEAPRAVTKGDLFRVTCTWENPTNAPISYPNEMCLAAGYLVSPTPFHCVGAPHLSEAS